MLDTVIVQPFDGVYIGHSREGPCWCFKVGVELFDEGCRGRLGEKDVNSFTNLNGEKVRSAANKVEY